MENKCQHCGRGGQFILLHIFIVERGELWVCKSCYKFYTKTVFEEFK